MAVASEDPPGGARGASAAVLRDPAYTAEAWIAKHAVPKTEMVVGGAMAQLPCYEVDGFGHDRFQAAAVPLLPLHGWPPLWATVLVDEVACIFHMHAVYDIAEAAREDAARMAMDLVADQRQRRRRLDIALGAAAVDIIERDQCLGQFDCQPNSKVYCTAGLRTRACSC